MNTIKYENKLPYPSKEEFTTTWWYRGGKAVAKRNPGMDIELLDPRVGTEIELGACVKEVVVDDAAYRAAKVAYGAETSRLQLQFKYDLFVELDIVGNPKADKLYTIAWQMGHSSGLGEVVTVAWDLVDLIKD